jgi:hypothetical protein
VITAKVTATGQSFAFMLNNRAQLSHFKVGESVYANFKTKQVSLDGTTIVGAIVSIGAPIPANGPVDGIRTNAGLMTSFTVAPNPADQSRKSALLNIRLAPVDGSNLPNSVCASLNGAAIDLVDSNHNGNYMGRLSLAEQFPYNSAISFNASGQQLTPHRASGSPGGAGFGGECHTVPCPPDCKSPTGFPCVVCISCSVTFGKPVTQSSQGSSKQ